MKRDYAALIVAVIFPNLMTWLYFVYLADPEKETNPTVQIVVILGKISQIAFPAIYIRLVDPQWIRLPTWNTRGVLWGIGFGLLTAGFIFGVYFGWLKGSPPFAKSSHLIFDKVQELGFGSAIGFLCLGTLISFPHSLLEEYFWRWFFFSRLNLHAPLWIAVLLSSLGFLSYHIIVLNVYLPEQFWTLTIPFSLAVGVGGAVWALLYKYSASLYAPWISHAIVDIAIMIVGYDIMSEILISTGT